MCETMGDRVPDAVEGAQQAKACSLDSAEGFFVVWSWRERWTRMRVSGVLAPEFIPAGTSGPIRLSAAARDNSREQQGICPGFCGLPAMTCGTAPIVVDDRMFEDRSTP